MTSKQLLSTLTHRPMINLPMQHPQPNRHPLTCVLVALVLCWIHSPALEASERPNVVILVSDDHGSQDFGFAGNRAVRTPHLDKLKQESLSFERFHVNPACAPTRASLLTGRDALASGVWGVHRGKDYLHPNEVTLALAMVDSGYATGCFGKWHNGKSLGYRARDRGFTDAVIAAESPYRAFDQTVLANGRPVSIQGPQDDVYVDRAIAFIDRAHKAKTPWLCYVPFPSVHRPLLAPAEMIKRYEDQGVHPELAALYAMIERQDANIGRLLRHIDKLGQRENTLVFFFVDDGQKPLKNKEAQQQRMSAWSRRYRGSKATIFQGGLHSPLLVRWPATCTPGTNATTLSSVNDLFPTLKDICGLQLPDDHLGFHGESLAGVLQGDDDAIAADRWFGVNVNYYMQKGGGLSGAKAYTASGGPVRAVLHGEYKYIHDKRPQLFHLKEDPLEQKNLVASMPDKAQEMKGLLQRYWTRNLQSPHALYQPRFQIGGWDHPRSHIYAYAPNKLAGGARRHVGNDHGKNHILEGLERKGASASFPVAVREAGSYRLHLLSSKNGKKPSGSARIAVGDAKADCTFDNPTETDKHWVNTSSVVDLVAGEANLVISVEDPGKDRAGIGELFRITVERVEGRHAVLQGLRLTGVDALTARGGTIRVESNQAFAKCRAWLDFEEVPVSADGTIVVPAWRQKDRLSINVVASDDKGRERHLHQILRRPSP